MPSSTVPSRRAGFLYLPPELIHHIHLLALNPFFPYTHPQVHTTLSHPPAHYVATYLLALYESYGPDDILVRAVRHPICTVEVARQMRRLWDFKRGFNKSFITGRGHNAEEGEDTSSEGAVDRQTSPPRTPTTTACPLTCSELPRRLFRFPPDPSCPIPPLLTYLFDSYSPSANSHKGYPLCRAVLAQNYPLIGCLLSYGADPSIKSCLVVEVAISLRDIKAVRMLIERGDGGKGASIDDEQGRRLSSERRRKKRRRISDRILITSRLVECAMRKGARDVVQYFMEEKGIMPPLDSIMKLSHAEIRASKTTTKSIVSNVL